MAMDRRDFVKWLALIAAGASALPEQVAAFERYYEVNTPQIASGLVSVDEIWISGMATSSMPAMLQIASPPMKLGMNLFGGVIRWVAAPDAKIIRSAKDFSWTLTAPNGHLERDMFDGHFSFIDQNAQRHYRPITIDGCLAD